MGILESPWTMMTHNRQEVTVLIPKQKLTADFTDLESIQHSAISIQPLQFLETRNLKLET